MASLADQPFNLFSHPRQEDYLRYPSPPLTSSVFTTTTSSTSSSSTSAAAHMDLDAFGHGQDMYSTPTTSSSTNMAGGYDPASLFQDATPNYLVGNGRASPAMYADDADLRFSSGLSTTASVPSAPSSAMGSPLSHHGQIGMVEWGQHHNPPRHHHGHYNHHHHGHESHALLQPGIVSSGSDYMEYSAFDDLTTFDFLQSKTFVDPSLIHPEINRPMAMSPYDAFPSQAGHHHQYPPASPSAVSSSPQPHMIRTNSSSPFLHSGPFQPAYVASPYATSIGGGADRRLSMGNFISPASDYPSESDLKEKQRCTYPDCGKIFKDLKAHMLTHQNERPEKCPIQTCEYHVKGFARKYDKNRHTLTHYKGTMVCGFCPGSGSAAEKSFNRADVFKRHLTAVHGVEQTPPNSRKKTAAAAAAAAAAATTTGVNAGKKLQGYAPDATGKCSTCSQTFSNAQDFYEHLDDCVLRIVQQEDPAEAINAQRLAEVENDKSVHMTLEKNNLPITTMTTQTTTTTTTKAEEDEDDYDMEGVGGAPSIAEGEDDAALAEGEVRSNTSGSPTVRKKGGNPANGVHKSRGMTHSRGGVALSHKPRGRKNRRDYPSSWGFDKGQVTMKKRIMAVFDGPRRLAKDDMMLSTDREVRIKLSDGKSYVTDLDVQTLNRANSFLGATEEEKGPWISDDPTEEQLQEMQRMLETS